MAASCKRLAANRSRLRDVLARLAQGRALPSNLATAMGGPTQVADVLIFSAAMGAEQWQTSRMRHLVRLRRNQTILLRSKRADPTRPTRASFASSSPTAATT
jgi:hypothetical protein